MESISSIFQRTNTNYSEYSNGRTFNYDGFYVTPNRLVKGNSKLHNILIFDMPAIATCLNCEDCKSMCYAMKAQNMYLDTKVFRYTNYSLFLNKRSELFNLIITQLQGSKQSVVRIHSSGDFFNQDYIEFWCNIISLFPNKRFYAYTKVDKILDFSTINKLGNFNLISSIIGDTQINFGSIDYCNSLNKKYNSFICPATKGENVKCGLQCDYCVTKNNVCFVQH
jgi:hypothetical protein